MRTTLPTAKPTTHRTRYRPHTDRVRDHVTEHIYRPRYRTHTDHVAEHVPTTYCFRVISVINSTEAAADSLVLADRGFALFHLVVQGCQVARLGGALPLLVDGGQGLPGLLGPLLLPRQLLLQPPLLLLPLLRHVVHGVRYFGGQGHFRVFFLEGLCSLKCFHHKYSYDPDYSMTLFVLYN